MLVEMKLKTSTSFRALSLDFAIMISVLKLPCSAPTHTTAINWVEKVGFYNLFLPKEKANDWIIILDESIQMGQNKILLIYGIREKNIDFNRPLKLQDLRVLRELVLSDSSGGIIAEELKELQNEIGIIKYAVCDGGRNLVKALSLNKTPHIHDLTHKLAIIVKKIFEKDTIYLKIVEEMTKLRKKYFHSKISHLIPPAIRTKSRFLNIDIISEWLKNTLRYVELKKENYDYFDWLLKYKDFIKDFCEINEKINCIEKLLKTNGFSKKTKNESEILLEELKNQKGEIFKDGLKEYFVDIENKMVSDKMLICSDIIESSFGKYKNYVSNNKMAGVTNLILCLSAFTSDFSEETIKKALESTTINDIKKWSADFIGKTVFQKRKEAFCT